MLPSVLTRDQKDMNVSVSVEISVYSLTKILCNHFSSLWKATGNYLVSSFDACTSQLTLAVTVSMVDNDITL